MVPPAQSDRSERARQIKQLAREVGNAFEDLDYPEIELDGELGAPLEVGREFPVPESRLGLLGSTHSYLTWVLRLPREHRRWLEHMVDTRNRTALERMLERLRPGLAASSPPNAEMIAPDVGNTRLEDRPGWLSAMEQACRDIARAKASGMRLSLRSALGNTDLADELPASDRQLQKWGKRFREGQTPQKRP